jgi:hypothetical protein
MRFVVKNGAAFARLSDNVPLRGKALCLPCWLQVKRLAECGGDSRAPVYKNALISGLAK